MGEILVHRNKGAWPEVRDRLNGLLRGWTAYFNYGTLAAARLWPAGDRAVIEHAHEVLDHSHLHVHDEHHHHDHEG